MNTILGNTLNSLAQAVAMAANSKPATALPMLEQQLLQVEIALDRASTENHKSIIGQLQLQQAALKTTIKNLHYAQPCQ